MIAVNDIPGTAAVKRPKSCPTMFNKKVEEIRKTYNNCVSKNKNERSEQPTWAQNVRSYFSEYCSCSGVHGVRYLGERGRFMIEKLFWTIIVTVICYFCVSLICKAYNKWVTSPVIVTFATTETPISKIPFPAITICPEVKSDPEIFNYTDVVLKKIAGVRLDEKQERYFKSLSLICDGGNTIVTELFGVGNHTISEDFVLDLITVLPDINRMINLTAALWLQKEYTLGEVLSGTFTSEGVCYSFNMLEFDEIFANPEEYVKNGSLNNTKSRRWSLEGGYPDDDNMDIYPRRTFISGIRGGFMIDLFTNKSHLDYLCGESLQGFKVTLHHPSELPEMDKHFRVPLDQAVYVGIKPRMITISQALRSYKPEDRKCYFDHERNLKHFKSYSQNNCLHECLSNYTLMKCGCSAFYMAKDDETPICGPGSNECLENSKVEYLSNHLKYEAENSSGAVDMTPCACLPSCTSLEYDVEISQTDWNWRAAFEVFGHLGVKDFPFDYEKTHISRLAVFYTEMQFLSSERNELYGAIDFFSSTGGLLGLFIGLSVTSLIEILYFLTLRLACNIKKFGKAFWAAESKLTNDENSSKSEL